MDIAKYLKKGGVTVKTVTQDKITVEYKGSAEHTFDVNDIEKYLFICLLDYIKEEIGESQPENDAHG
jgi:uncharacterized Zn finger protein